MTVSTCSLIKISSLIDTALSDNISLPLSLSNIPLKILVMS
ncbi:hypothetical protein JSCD7_34820 [Clostridioides difficile]|nr:hypothetical protein JSCD7_34820 [Clostridioides difficile]